MNINIQSVHFEADAKLKDLIVDKLQKLQKYYNSIISIDVFLKLENSGQVKDKIIELKTHIPGETLVVSASDKSFEVALDKVDELIVRQLKKSKEKQRA